jgi:hypothetical protein
MSHTPQEAKAVSTSWQGFLWNEIRQIREAQRLNDYGTAIANACSLVAYLPPKVKDELKHDVEDIAHVLNIDLRVESSDFFTTMQLRNRTISREAKRYLAEFIDKMMRLLHETGIYTEYKQREVAVGQELNI